MSEVIENSARIEFCTTVIDPMNDILELAYKFLRIIAFVLEIDDAFETFVISLPLW